MTPIFDPTITLGNVLTLVILGLPAIWWAGKITQVVKDTKDDVTEVKQTMITRSEVGILKQSADEEHGRLNRRIDRLESKQ